MSEEERKLIAVIVSVLVGTLDDPNVHRDLEWATKQAGLSAGYLNSVLDEVIAAAQ